MEQRILSMIEGHSSWIILVLAGMLCLMALILIVLLVKINYLTKRYDLFMRGKDCENMEDTIIEIYRKLQFMQNRDVANKDVLKMMSKNLAGTIAKTGLVKYNAFAGMGGQSSFALALLTQDNHGYILNAVHNRNSCYVYVKTISNGEPDEILGEEEQRALDKALGIAPAPKDKNAAANETAAAIDAAEEAAAKKAVNSTDESDAKKIADAAEEEKSGNEENIEEDLIDGKTSVKDEFSEDTSDIEDLLDAEDEIANQVFVDDTEEDIQSIIDDYKEESHS